MYRFKKSLIALIGVLTLVGIATITIPKTGRGASGSGNNAPANQTQNVNVVNTPTVNAQQSGTWNVGIAGTPTVGIDPANNIIRVDTASPLAVYDLDNGRQPFQEGSADTISDGAQFSIHTITTVPAGKRLVIEHVSVLAPLNPGQRLIVPAIETMVNGVGVRHYLISNAQGSNGVNDYFTASQDVRFYADPGTAVRGFASRDGTTGKITYVFSISGYLINLPQIGDQ